MLTVFVVCALLQASAWEQTGLWPLNPDAVQEKLRSATNNPAATCIPRISLPSSAGLLADAAVLQPHPMPPSQPPSDIAPASNGDDAHPAPQSPHQEAEPHHVVIAPASAASAASAEPSLARNPSLLSVLGEIQLNCEEDRAAFSELFKIMVAKPKEVTTAIKRYVNEQNVTEILPQKNAPGMQHKRARVDGGHFMTGDEYIKSMQDKESEKKQLVLQKQVRKQERTKKAAEKQQLQEQKKFRKKGQQNQTTSTKKKLQKVSQLQINTRKRKRETDGETDLTIRIKRKAIDRGKYAAVQIQGDPAAVVPAVVAVPADVAVPAAAIAVASV